MNFIEAYSAILNGKKVRVKGWWENAYICKNVNYNYIYIMDGKGQEYTFLNCDYLSAWELYEEKPKLHTFEEAVVALKAGKKISRDPQYADVHKIGWDDKFIFEEEDLFANDWIIEGE